MEAFGWASLAALVLTAVNFVKYLRARQWDAVVKQAIAWVAGIALVVIAAHSDFGASLPIMDRSLDQFNWASQVLIGLSLASLGGAFNELKSALDNTDTAAKPPIVR